MVKTDEKLIEEIIAKKFRTCNGILKEEFKGNCTQTFFCLNCTAEMLNEAITKARESEREKVAKEIFEKLDEILNFNCCDEQDIEDGCACLTCMRFPELREKFLGKKVE